MTYYGKFGHLNSSCIGKCSIYVVIVYGRKVLWAIKKHMVKCRVESVIACVY